MFQNLVSTWNDPLGKKRIIFIVAVSVGVILLLIGIIQLNFGGRSSNTTTNSNLTGDSGIKKQVSTASFGDSQILERVDPVALGSNGLAFAGNGKPIYLNSSLKLRLNNKDIENSPSFAVPSISNSAEGVIINEPNRSTVYSPDGKFKQIAQPNFSLTQYFVLNSSGVPTVSKWAYINFTSNLYTVRSSDNINLTTDTVLATISPTITTSMVELVNFNQRLYFIAWENPTRQGNMEIWSVKEKTPPQKIFSKAQVQSVVYGPDSLIVTTFSQKPTELTLYQSVWLDFKVNPTGNPTDLQLDFTLSQNKVFGTLLAQRCALDVSGTAYCLLKESKVPYTSYVSKDVILKINLRLNTISKIQENLSISAGSIHLDGSGNLYIVSQEDRVLYRVIT
jgi:hypothetical protein